MAFNMDRTVITVSLNPVIDIHYFIDDFKIGKDNIPFSRSTFAAGKGMNVSRALQAFDIPNDAFMLLGRENSAVYLRLSEEYGISLSYILTNGAVRENISVNTPSSETRICMKNYTAAQADLDRLGDLIRKSVQDGCFIVFSGSLPVGISEGMFTDFVLSIKSTAKDIKIILDCPTLTADTIAMISPYLIKPNQSEAEALIGAPNGVDCAKTLCHTTQCSHVVISRGSEGAEYATLLGMHGFVKAPVIDRVISTVGAGDSMLAGIIYGILQQKTGRNDAPDFEKALRWGISFGSAACLTKGTCPPVKEEVLRLINSLESGPH